MPARLVLFRNETNVVTDVPAPRKTKARNFILSLLPVGQNNWPTKILVQDDYFNSMQPFGLSGY